MRRLVTAVVVLLIGGGAYAAYRSEPEIQRRVSALLAQPEDQKTKARRRPPAPVITAVVAKRDVPVILEGVGNVQAVSTVEIKSRIDGQLFEALVSDGEFVKQGDLLFRLDARPLQVQLQQAEANAARDKANLDKARVDVARYEQLATKGIAPQTRYEEAQSLFVSLQAAIRSSEAAVELARLNLDYATIRSPISGRVGSVLLSPGNMVKANDTQPMLVITQTRPINVIFSVPEQHIGELRALLATGQSPDVAVTVPGDDAPTAPGRLFFVNNVVDTSTGTIQLMARFENQDERLVPGQFVRANLVMRTLHDAVVAPTKSVQINQRGHYVWVVKADKTVEARPVVVGRISGSEIAITEGLEAGETVVTDGQLRLYPKATVQPVEPALDKPKARIQS
jgi:multidrug efflux system membrane fusion protein